MKNVWKMIIFNQTINLLWPTEQEKNNYAAIFNSEIYNPGLMSDAFNLKYADLIPHSECSHTPAILKTDRALLPSLVFTR